MIDDSADKLRRNVVVFSGAVLASEFVGVRFSDLVAPLIGSSSPIVSAVAGQRGQILTVIVFVYLVTRWASSDEHQAAKTNLRERWERALYDAITHSITIAIERATTAEQLPPWVNVSVDYGGYFGFRDQVRAFDDATPAHRAPKWEISGTLFGRMPNFQFKIERVRTTSVPTEMDRSGAVARVAVEYPRVLFGLLKCRLMMRFVVAQQPTLVVFVPGILAAIAFVVLMCRLFI